ncbi:MAG: hypothetical protein QM488_19925 [Rhizobiaceae bacterium]
MKTKIHGFFGIVALLCVLSFWIGTVVSEIFGSPADIALVKLSILKGMMVLVPAMVLAGASGFSMKWRGPMVELKKRRMKIIAANGVLILLPLAFFLSNRAQIGDFDAWFYGVQIVELLAGATNISLLSLNMRDGIMSVRKRRAKAG